jgi:hypothetical protein
MEGALKRINNHAEIREPAENEWSITFRNV